MTPENFIAIWKDNKLNERAGAQAHFDDLCDLLGVAKPRDPESYCFERGAKKAGGGAPLRPGSRQGGANRKVLERIVDTTRIFEAWSDEE